MKKLSIILLLIAFICSCQKNKTKIIEENIRGKEYKFWLFVKKIPTLENSIFGADDFLCLEYFDKNGRFHHLYYYFKNMKEKIKSDVDDDEKSDFIESHTWSLKNDSVITINELDFIIKRLTPDLMVLENSKTNVYFYYVSAPVDLLSQKFNQKFRGNVSNWVVRLQNTGSQFRKSK